MKKVIIFGCNGFVGKYLSEELVTHGYAVYGSDHSECNKNVKKNLEGYNNFELTDFNSVCQMISRIKPDVIINLAAISSVAASWSIPQQTVEVNLVGALNILEAVKNTSIETKIMLVGSSEEYAISTERISEEFPIVANNPYGLSKVAQEHFADLYRNEYGLRIVNTRTFNHTGFGQQEKFAIPSFVRQVADIHNSGKPGVIRVGNLNVKRDLGNVKDMVSAYRMILESNSKHSVFNVGSGTTYKMADILNYIVSLSEQPITIKIDSTKLRPVDNPVIWCDNTRLIEETGWKPQFTVYDAIDEMFEKMTKKA